MVQTELAQKAELKQVQGQLADILKQVVDICDRYGITYSMAWESCLGAVRHQDFIPWDDDIDLYIPYSQIAKFKTCCMEELPEDYFYQDMETDPNYFLVYPKIRKTSTTSINEKDRDVPMHWGIGIDIFPLFEVASSDAVKKIQSKVKVLRRLGYMPYYAIKKQGIYQKGMAAFYRMIGRKTKNRWCKKMLDSFQQLGGNYYLDIEDISNHNTVYLKEWFSTLCEKPFGTLNVKVMNGYDAYLSQVYGSDYMIVPKKGSANYYTHENVIIDCEQSYQNYLTKKQ